MFFMKKMYRFSFLWLLLASLFYACNPSEPQVVSGKYGKGVLVINEGNFTEGNGSLSFIRQDNEVLNRVFEDENNGAAVGGIIQSVRGYSLGSFSSVVDKLAIVTNNQDQVLIVDADTLRALAIIRQPNVDNPQAFASIGNKGFVTNWGDITKAFGSNPEGFITEIDLRTRTFVRKINTPNLRPQGIVAFNNKLYVANNNSNTVSVLNSSGEVVQTIVVADSPDRFVIDNNNKIWVICNSNPDFTFNGNDLGTLVRINPITDQTEASIANVPCGGFNSKIAFGNGKIYSIRGKKVFSIDIASNQVAELINNEEFSLYGIGVNPQDGEIYVGEATFTQGSRVRRYSPSGSLIREYTAGRGTNGFIFYR
ncbi:MAG: hypothetical protein OHK0045_04470 [Raineya sp.]